MRPEETSQSHASSVKQNKLRERYQRGRKNLWDNKSTEALSDFEYIVGVQPDFESVHLLMGFVYQQLGNKSKALKEFSEEIKVNPNKSIGYEVRGDLYENDKMYQEAVGDYSEAIKLAPEQASLYQARAHIYEKMGKDKKALLDFDKAIEINPSDDFLFYRRGKLNMKMGNRSKAIEDFGEVLKLNDTNHRASEAHFHRGVLLYLDGKYSEALSDLSEVKPPVASLDHQQEFQALLISANCHKFLGESEKYSTDIKEAFDSYSRFQYHRGISKGDLATIFNEVVADNKITKMSEISVMINSRPTFAPTPIPTFIPALRPTNNRHIRGPELVTRGENVENNHSLVGVGLLLAVASFALNRFTGNFIGRSIRSFANLFREEAGEEVREEPVAAVARAAAIDVNSGQDVDPNALRRADAQWIQRILQATALPPTPTPSITPPPLITLTSVSVASEGRRQESRSPFAL